MAALIAWLPIVRVDELVKDLRPPEAAALRAVLDKFINTNRNAVQAIKAAFWALKQARSSTEPVVRRTIPVYADPMLSAEELERYARHIVLRVARTLADLDGTEKVGRVHLAEALSYRALADEIRRAA